MLTTRNEILSRFTAPVFIPHPVYPGLETFDCLAQPHHKPRLGTVELPTVKIVIREIDYLRGAGGSPIASDQLLRFRKDYYQLWYQVDGFGILQNATQNNFGTARPGLLGVMDQGERHTYMHQRGAFECFILGFSILPSANAKCYWNSEIEGKKVLPEAERLVFENLIFELFWQIADNKEILGIASMSNLLQLLVQLYSNGLLLVEESQFPTNKPKSLVAKAKQFMKLNYASLHHQDPLEKECGVDINYLNILFKKETGKTLYRYLSDIRMEHAKYLLEGKDFPVTEIAARIGYPNSNSFTRAFKKQNRISPTEYRESHDKSIKKG